MIVKKDTNFINILTELETNFENIVILSYKYYEIYYKD